jgi:hypothetical protein
MSPLRRLFPAIRHAFTGPVLLGPALVASVTACSNCSVNSIPPERYEEGTVSESGLTYQSTIPEADLLPFPPGQVYDLVHGLGAAPTSVQGYVSFAPRLTADGDPFDPFEPNNISESAGNEMLIELWNDEIVRIRNDTCAMFYVRVVVTLDPVSTTGAPPLGAAGASGN